jgi:hypothetical protein
MAPDGVSTLSGPLGLSDEFGAGPQLAKYLVSFCTSSIKEILTYTHLLIDQNNINIKN